MAVAQSHSRTKRSGRAGKDATAEVVVKTVVQMLFAGGKSFTVDGLREKLREFYREEVRAERRAAAALTNVELIAMLLDCNQRLELVGLQLRMVNGVVSLLTTEVENERLADFLRAQLTPGTSGELTTVSLEVLACIAFKQPVSQAEIDRLFAADKRSVVVRLRDLQLVEEFAGTDGRLRFVTTAAFLRRFGLADLDEVRASASVYSGFSARQEVASDVV